MPRHYDYPDSYEDDWIRDDPEAPQERDLVDEDDDETPTVPCPNCRRPIADSADRCPYCGDWIVQTAGASPRRKPWIVAVVILLVLSFVLWWVL